MTTLDERIAACEAELSRLRAEREAERKPRRWWAQLAVPGSGYAVAGWIWLSEGEAANACGIDGDRYIQTPIQLVELRPGWRVVRDGPAPPIPEHVRKLIGRIDQFRMCMSYNESYFGEPVGLLKGVFAELGTAVNPIYPDGTTALYPGTIPAVAEGVGS